MTNYVSNIQQRLSSIQTNDTNTKGATGTAPQQSGNLGRPDKAEVELALSNLKSATRVSGADGLGAPMALAKTLCNNEQLLIRIGEVAEKDRTAEMKEFLKVMDTAANLGALMIQSADVLKGSLTQLYDVLNVVADDQNSDVVSEITRLIQQMLINVNRTVTSMSVNAMNHQFDSAMKAADEMDSAAEDRFKAALVQGITSIATGVISITVGLRSAQTGYEASRAADRVGPNGVASPLDRLEVAALSRSSAMANTVSRGMGESGQGIGTAASAGYTLSASKHDADKQRHDAVGSLAGQTMQSAQNLMQTLKEAMNKMVDLNAQLGTMDANLLKKILS